MPAEKALSKPVETKESALAVTRRFLQEIQCSEFLLKLLSIVRKTRPLSSKSVPTLSPTLDKNTRKNRYLVK
ncbi:MAG: hypothetical protein AAF402_16785, partial [Pseudomonadota bacterium]